MKIFYGESSKFASRYLLPVAKLLRYLKEKNGIVWKKQLCAGLSYLQKHLRCDNWRNTFYYIQLQLLI